MEDTQVKRFDPNGIANTLKDKVKKEFVNLIPEAYWDTFIADTTKKFLETDLENVVKDVLREESKKQVVKYVDDNVGGWDVKKQRTAMDERMKTLIVQQAPLMFAEIMEQMIMSVMQNLRNRGY